MSESPQGKTQVSRRSIGWKVFGVCLAALLVGGSIWLLWGLSRFGDQGPSPGLPIENRTDSQLQIFAVIRDAGVSGSPVIDEELLSEIPAHTTEDSGIDCAAGELVARDLTGGEVARRDRGNRCDETTWIIESPR